MTYADYLRRYAPRPVASVALYYATTFRN